MIDRVEAWPTVGRSSLVFFDDPNAPGVEQWRMCSTIRSITSVALAAKPGDDPEAQHKSQLPGTPAS